MQLLYVLLLAWARCRARAPIVVTGGPMADRSRPAALEKVGVQNGVSLHDAEKVDGVATGVAIPNGSARFPTIPPTGHLRTRLARYPSMYRHKQVHSVSPKCLSS